MSSINQLIKKPYHPHSDEEIWRKIMRLRKRRAVHRHRGNNHMVECRTVKIEKLLGWVNEKVVFT